MAMNFVDIKNACLMTLYDYMLTSDDDEFFYATNQILENISDASGAFVRRALDSLVSDKDVELGGNGEGGRLYALTDQGIETVEELLTENGISIANYSPAPEMHRLISKAEEPLLHQEIEQTLQKVANHIRESNEVGNALGDSKDLVSGELEAGAVLTSKDRFRLSRLNALILPTLRFLADKFVGQALGELAKQLTNLLMKIP